MRKIFSIILSAVMTVLYCGIISGYAAYSVRLEAENATATDWVVRNGATFAQAKKDIPGSWDFTISEDGMYSVNVFYATNATNSKATLTLGTEKLAEAFPLNTTGGNNINTGSSVSIVENYAIKAGNYTLTFLAAGNNVTLDYIDIVKTGNYAGNSLDGDTSVLSTKYETTENTSVDNGLLKMPANSNAVYTVSEKTENIYGVKINAYGTAEIRVYADDVLAYSGSYNSNELFLYEFSDTASNIKLEVISGELAAESIDFVLKDPASTSAEAGYTEYQIEASDGYETNSTINKTEGTCGVNIGDWFDFVIDAGEYGTGEYKITLRYATKGTVGVKFEADSGDTLEANVYSTGAWNTFTVTELGTINIGSETDKLRLSVTTSSGMTADWFSLEKVDVTPKFKFISVDGKIPALNSTVNRSADFVDIVFSYYIDSESVNSDNVKLISEGGEIPCDIEVIDTVIRLKLKESLDYSQEYTVTAANSVKGSNGENIPSEIQAKFQTGDNDDVTSKGTVVIDSYSNDYENFTVSGAVLSSKETGISGRNVSVTAYDKNGMTAALENAETVSGENGAYELSFTVDENAESGEMRFVVSAEYAENAEFTLTYISKSFESNILEAIASTTDAQGVEQIFNENQTLLKINPSADFEGIADKEAIYSRFAGKTFESLEAVLNEYKRGTTFHDAGDTVSAASYSVLTDGNTNGNNLTLKPNGEVKYNFSLSSQGYYVVRINAPNVNGNAAEIYFGDTLISSPSITAGNSTAATVKAESGKTVVTLKNVSQKDFSFSDITIAKVNTEEAKKGFGSVKVNGWPCREGEGVGYYFKAGKNTNGTNVGINNGDWFYYDFATAGAGTYKVTFQYVSPRDTVVNYKDEEGQVFTFELPATGSGWTVTKIYEAGTITLKGDNVWLYLTSDIGLSLHYVIFERIDTPLSYYATFADGNITADNDKISRGTDKLDIHFTSIPQSADASKIQLKTANGTIPCDYEINENVVSLKLKETLDFNTEYMLSISGLTSNTNQPFKGETKVKLLTADETVNSGNDNAEITDSSISYEAVTLKGVVKSSADVPIKGRSVRATARDLNGTPVSISQNTGISGENGEFTLTPVIPEGTSCGDITFSIYSEYGLIPAEAVLSYVSETAESAIINQLKATAAASDVEEFFDNNKDVLSLDVTNDLTSFTETEKEEFYGSFIGNEYADVNEIKDAYKSTVMMFEINGAANVRELSEAFENTEYLEKTGVDTAMLSEVSEYKNTLLSEIVALNKNTDTDALAESCNDIITANFLKEYGKTTIHFVTNGSSVNTNQSVELKTGFNNETTDVKELNMTFTASQNGFFNNAAGTDSITVSADGKHITYKKAHDGSKVTEAGKINITAPSLAGNYTVTVSGGVIYEITADSGKVYTVADTGITKDITVTVSQISSSLPESSSKPAAGGGGGGGGSVSKEENKDNAETEDNTENTQTPDASETPEAPTKEEYKFTDLGNCSWAEKSIYHLLGLGIISENETKLFYPDNNITRAEFVKMIVTAFGLTDYNASVSFNDVAPEAWYYIYVASAVKYGIVTGDDSNNFRPESMITREDMAVIINRLLLKLGFSSDMQADAFSDDGSISDYAKEAVYTVRKIGIINGIGNNLFAPKQNATRAQAAKMIYELISVCR